MKRIINIFALSLLLISCSQSSTSTKLDNLATPTFTSLTSPEVQPSAISFHLPPVIKETECNQTLSGHILFLTSKKELYSMDGNGCNHHLIMTNVSGSPDWSVDGKYISIGCENNQYICILDASRTLGSCEDFECEAAVVEKYNLPKDAEYPVVLSTSWSFDGKKLLASITSRAVANIYLLSLENGNWRLLIKKTDRFGDLSPIKDEIIFDGLEKMPLDLNNGYIETYHVGEYPQWSPDGKSVAFIYEVNQNQPTPIEPFGIMQWTFDTEPPWKILYQPAPIDWDNWETRNVVLSFQGGQILSWSPDSRYIAFVGDYRYKDDAQIFRLDTETGEIVVLTTKISQEQNQTKYFSPAWGQ